MKKTPPGTRALIRKYLKASEKEDYSKSIWTEEEIAKRIGPGKAIVLDGKVITAHQGVPNESCRPYWLFVYDRIGLDDQDDMIPTIETPFDDVEDDEEEPPAPIKESKKKETKKIKKKVAVL